MERSGSRRDQPKELTVSRNELVAMIAIRFCAGSSYTLVEEEQGEMK